jgi:CubicO group peptidase (beta-lactamase class C family)
MQTELFDPMGMKNSRVWNLFSAEETFPNKTDDFDAMLKKTLKPTLLDGVAGDGAVFCSVEDFLIWDKFWYSNDIISQESINEAFTPPSLPDGKETNSGFGWVIQGNMIWHNGSWLGARTFFGRNVKEKTCIALLDNSSNINSEGILREIQKAGIITDE